MGLITRSANLSLWNKERNNRPLPILEGESFVDTRIERHAEGGMDVYIHIRYDQIPEEIQNLLRSYMELGYVSMGRNWLNISMRVAIHGCWRSVVRHCS